MTWLFKEEPTHFSFDDLMKDGRASWSGVRNPLAQIHLRAVRKGDRVLYYHTGNEKRVVGIARAIGDPYADPDDKAGRRVAVDIAPVRELKRPVTLGEIRATKSLAKFPLVRISRLSVMPVNAQEWARIEKMASR